jgi:hypothetical protein
MHSAVDGADRLMRFADVLVAARTLRDFVFSYELVPAGALARAVETESASAA